MVKVTDNAKLSSNWIMTEVLRELKESGRSIEESKINSEDLGKIINLIQKRLSLLK